MNKKEYMQPTMQVVQIRQRSNMLLNISGVTTTKVKEDDPEFEYDRNGGDQEYAW